jgi:hypothetical protein
MDFGFVNHFVAFMSLRYRYTSVLLSGFLVTNF